MQHISQTILKENKEVVNLQYRSKISEPKNAFATRCKRRVNALVEKTNAFSN